MQPLALPSLAGKPSLTELVYDTIKRSLVNGRFTPGSRLREADLARHLGVSATPVREALTRLDREGLVVIQPRRGAVVAAPSARTVTELFETRQALESWAIRHAGSRCLTADLAGLDTLLARMAPLCDAADQGPFYRLDLEFHAALCRLSGNDRLAELCMLVHQQLQALGMSSIPTVPDQPRRSHDDHLAIVAALRRHDVEAAAERLLAHLDAARDDVLAALHGRLAPAVGDARA